MQTLCPVYKVQHERDRSFEKRICISCNYSHLVDGVARKNYLFMVMNRFKQIQAKDIITEITNVLFYQQSFISRYTNNYL